MWQIERNQLIIGATVTVALQPSLQPLEGTWPRLACKSSIRQNSWPLGYPCGSTRKCYSSLSQFPPKHRHWCTHTTMSLHTSTQVHTRSYSTHSVLTQWQTGDSRAQMLPPKKEPAPTCHKALRQAKRSSYHFFRGHQPPA